MTSAAPSSRARSLSLLLEVTMTRSRQPRELERKDGAGALDHGIAGADRHLVPKVGVFLDFLTELFGGPRHRPARR